MKRSLLGMALLFVLGAAGCASMPHTQPANIDDMPGTDHMAKGPGLFDRHSPYASDDGLVIYSNDPNQPSLAGSGRAKAQTGASSAPAQPSSTGGAPTSASPIQPPNYQQYKEFEEYQRFKNMPKDSPEYRQFQQWLQWKRYQAWKAQQQAQPAPQQ